MVKVVWQNVVLLLLVSCTVWADSSPYLLQAAIDKHTLKRYFPQANVKQADRINCVMLKPKLRPPSWTDRIPFGVAIDSQANTAYYLVYESFFNKRIMSFPNMNFRQLSDIAVHSDGMIALADEGGNQIQFFQFKYPNVSSVAFVKTPAPHRVEFDSQGKLWCLNALGVAVFQPGQNNLEPIKEIGERISQALTPESLVDLSVTRTGDLIILSSDRLIKFNSDGTLEGSIPISRSSVAVETSAYGEIWVLRGIEKKIEVYSPQLEHLASIDIASEFKSAPKDITLYDNFGYVIVNSEHEGAYYGMGVSIGETQLTSIEESAGGGYHISFTTSMPAYLWVTVQGQTLEERRELVANILQKSGRQTVFWDGKLNGQLLSSGTVSVRALAAYSLGNTHKAEIKF